MKQLELPIKSPQLIIYISVLSVNSTHHLHLHLQFSDVNLKKKNIGEDMNEGWQKKHNCNN